MPCIRSSLNSPFLKKLTSAIGRIPALRSGSTLRRSFPGRGGLPNCSGMEKLVACPYKRPNALCRLICFPWAGGGTSQFAKWGKLFNSSIEVSSVRLPGRESHLKKPFAKDMKTVVNEITSVLLKELQEKTFAFFGHSFGSYLSFAVALHLKEKYGLEPIHLFVSGGHAPNSEAFLPIKSIPMYDTEDEDILTYIQTSGGTSSELLQNEEIKNHLLLTFKEDLRVLQTFFFEKAERNISFSCDITCFNGSEDKPYDLEAWHDLTSGGISFYKLPGDHFYLLEPSNEIFLIKHITRCIENAGL
ncbi:S-acyl fatty acid synthase thioesterase, medium chain isoform X1 [Falco rusticolus]|uniref:S-acyl fatty acid synthase thioesterase, medium chain isoform X1 n=2 Tax=Falco cherrug TaxID=345164 RepID=UPI000FFB3D59|nr:S-acyl fatty acid synthase thioesterase, medium chain isoform X1 [Falco cherrug]XP_037241059.1 S-acyl fatty acid synthase thioesterase, medium chain isoform X1 [Falco rusticolus]XP_037241060.1 S-acyl fatty acid synthase thioesterase, medium chain isoform X1 [Falco rusticolus]XP_037241061.1 S-acyl fatty acid synthase thioesterase, medium chain isoform X1 [Falco rusticolus]XP_037241062.1 S-acyl fatty acid synthase thioesterase, medium chain isoform X1 [Falco rusticolus]XP_055564548.1 S-acyl f